MRDVDQGPERARAVPRWVTRTVGGLIALVVLLYGAIFVYTEFVKNSPGEFDEGDLAAALDDEHAFPGPTDAPPAASESSAGASDGSVAPAPAPVTEAPADGAPAAGATTWEVTSDSELGYRVKEILFGVDTEGVGRTNEIVGWMTIAGTTVTDAEFVVDVASITSDEGRRDNQFRGRIMSTDEFPTATFVLTEPIELGVEPSDGATVATTATGELTLRGVTNTVTFDVNAQQEGGRIGVLGAIPVVFADYGIANPSIGGITTEDEGLLEFVLVFRPVT